VHRADSFLSPSVYTWGLRRGAPPTYSTLRNLQEVSKLIVKLSFNRDERYDAISNDTTVLIIKRI